MYEWLCFEDCMSYSGELLLGGKFFIVNFVKSGNYNLILCDKDGLIFVGLSYVVSGKGSMVYIGMVDIVVDKMLYQSGEIVKMLIIFSELIDEVLLMLECDCVEQQLLFLYLVNWLML